jgi:hypothetical protein
MIYQGKNFAFVDGSDDPLLIDLEDGLNILEAWKQLHAPKLDHDKDLDLLAQWCEQVWAIALGEDIRNRVWRQPGALVPP